ncbi:11314_t:CDS:2 [Ambispora leptoticha]|uniref:11314_t:CDS:1 n=1 Tax=Ambispora leptoticha TaxID=144679 RepID=A0A9N8VMR2_9GLOM|nr:11314_t:CDS:2 [Ambispora leptoticha]
MIQTKIYIFLKEFFNRYHLIEPKSIVVCRGISALLILALLTTFTAFLIIDIRDDGPVLQKTTFEADSLPIPDVVISSLFQFKLGCTSVKLTTNEDCTQYVSQPVQSASKTWESILSLNKILGGFSVGDLIGIRLSLSINDDNFDITKSTGYAIFAFDPEFGPYSNKASASDSDLLSFLNIYGTKFTASLNGLNSFIVPFKTGGVLSFSRTIKEIITKTQSNTFGIPASYIQQTYITSDYQLLQYDRKTEYILIAPRTYTFLEALALFGGIWVIAAGVYTCLLGTTALRPWGLVHSCCFPNDNRKHIRNRFPTIPLFSPTANSNFPNEKNFGTDDEFKTRVEERFNALEVFLKDYVVNAECLEEFVKSANNDKRPLSGATSTLPANVNSNSVKIENDPNNLSRSTSVAYPNDLPVYGAPSKMTYPPQVAHNIQPMNMQFYES